MKVVLILFLSILKLNGFAQFPIGKNVKAVKSELVNFLKIKGFHFLTYEVVDEDFDAIKFSEEFTIYAGKNSYENIEYLTFSTFKKSVYEKLKNAFNFSTWKYSGLSPNVTNEIEPIYLFKNYRIRMPFANGCYQFIVKLADEN